MIYKGDNKTLVINKENNVSTIEFTWDGLKIKAVIDTRKQSLTSLSCYDRDGNPEDIGNFCQLAVEVFVGLLERFGSDEERSAVRKELVLF